MSMSAARAKREVDAANASRRSPHYPGWFEDFLADCAIRKLSPHTIKAYRQDFNAIARQVAGTADAARNLRTDELTKVSLRLAFAGYADTHSAASVRRCWSTWNTLCTYLLTAELVQANPMPFRRPTSRWAKSCSSAALSWVFHSCRSRARVRSPPARSMYVWNRWELNHCSTQGPGAVTVGFYQGSTYD